MYCVSAHTVLRKREITGRNPPCSCETAASGECIQSSDHDEYSQYSGRSSSQTRETQVVDLIFFRRQLLRLSATLHCHSHCL